MAVDHDIRSAGETMSASTSVAPSVFVSYAWTNASHQAWVVDLATRLRGDGVNVILDVWELKPGHDKYKFMERTVADPSVEKVLLICNESYSAKANERSGGVGDETQIISPELYASTTNEKFIPVIAERDADGEPHLPAYLKARIYVDLSSEQVYFEGYEKLLRLLHGAPAFPKPALGEKPKFLSETAATGSTTVPLLRRAIRALEEERRGAQTMAREHLSASADAIRQLRFRWDRTQAMDDMVVAAIQASKAHRDEVLELLESLCGFGSDETVSRLLLDFFENLLAGCGQTEQGSYHEAEFDGVRFVTMELFFYAITILLGHDRNDVARRLLEEVFVYQTIQGTTRQGFEVFCFYIESLEEQRKRRLKSDRLSIVADLFKERADRKTVPFVQLQQTDFLLYLRAKIHTAGWWYPRTLAYLSYAPQPFELFLAQDSPRRFARIKAVLDVRDSADLRSKAEATFPDRASRTLDTGGFRQFSIFDLMNIKQEQT